MADSQDKVLRGLRARVGWALRVLRDDRRHPPRPKSLAAALDQKRVVVTGASSGIGRALALQVAAHGGLPVLVARSRPKLEQVQREIEAAGGSSALHVADLSVAADCERLVREVLADGPVDVLINNAGRSIRRSVRHSYQRVHDFERTMALNYFGSLRLILGILPHMRARRSGHVINISSAGVLVTTPRFAAYVASKAALDAFSKVAAAESYGDKVYFSTVYMPLVRTPMIEPTKAYRGAPALSSDQAATLALSALVSRKTRIAPPLGVFFAASRALRPEGTLRTLSALYRLTGAGDTR